MIKVNHKRFRNKVQILVKIITLFKKIIIKNRIYLFKRTFFNSYKKNFTKKSKIYH